jgi:hypothetical protein
MSTKGDGAISIEGRPASKFFVAQGAFSGGFDQQQSGRGRRT